LDFWSARFGEQIGTLVPVLAPSIVFKVLAIIHVIDLTVGWILPGFEEIRSVLGATFFPILSHSTLLLLKEVFVVGCSLHVAILQSPLIGSPSRISRRDLVMQPGWEVVHLQREVTHAVHHICLLRIGRLAPDYLSFTLLRFDTCE